MPDHDTPLAHVLRVTTLRRIDIAARAGVSLPIINAIVQGDEAKLASMKLGKLAAVAWALGMGVAELVPWLAQVPRKGLVWEIGYRKRIPKERYEAIRYEDAQVKEEEK